MPLFRGSQIVGGADPDGSGGEVITGPVIPEIGTYDPVWIAPDGTVLPLNPPGAPHFSLRGVGGLGTVPVDVVSTPAPDGGSVVDYVLPKARTIQWPLRIRAGTHLEFLAAWRYVSELFAQTRRLGPGLLRIYRPDGTAREIPAYYQTGLEGDPDEGAWTRVSPVVGLFCPDPFWRSPTAVRNDWRQQSQPDYLTPYPTLSSGQVIGAATVRNDGHADAWPTWTLRGPMTQLVAANLTRGETFTIAYPLVVGQTLTMTTRPIQVRGPGGVQAISALNLLSGGIPWRLDADRDTAILFTASGAAGETAAGLDNGTMISAEFTPRFETA